MSEPAPIDFTSLAIYIKDAMRYLSKATGRRKLPSWKRKLRCTWISLHFIARLKLNLRFRLTHKELTDVRAAYLHYGLQNPDSMNSMVKIRDVLQLLGHSQTDGEMRETLAAVRYKDGCFLTPNQFEHMMTILKRNFVKTLDSDTGYAFIALGGNRDKTGDIDADVMRDIVKRFELTIDLEGMLAEVDTNGNGQIDFEEFSEMFEGEPQPSAREGPIVVSPTNSPKKDRVARIKDVMQKKQHSEDMESQFSESMRTEDAPNLLARFSRRKSPRRMLKVKSSAEHQELTEEDMSAILENVWNIRTDTMPELEKARLFTSLLLAANGPNADKAVTEALNDPGVLKKRPRQRPTRPPRHLAPVIHHAPATDQASSTASGPLAFPDPAQSRRHQQAHLQGKRRPSRLKPIQGARSPSSSSLASQLSTVSVSTTTFMPVNEMSSIPLPHSASYTEEEKLDRWSKSESVGPVPTTLSGATLTSARLAPLNDAARGKTFPHPASSKGSKLSLKSDRSSMQRSHKNGSRAVPNPRQLTTMVF
eukprot:NODE_794_length_2087_cov_87.382383_g755_i0.p1 GENE.NODE_794_length_2087_cov_87.382383_g755_i0~~NODE_794_length_2087_cov_87.382383_g755_i0.p1  ORF type:complete len:534 (-),score=76.86 NODE_794_length_2087_cov_87.382383_g755_i0:348-1949(-)